MSGLRSAVQETLANRKQPSWKPELAAFRNQVDQEQITHGVGGWELAKYERKPDGAGRFLYVRNTGERRSVMRPPHAEAMPKGDELRYSYFANLLVYLRLEGQGNGRR